MRQFGRVNVVALTSVGILVVVVVALALSFLREAPAAVASKFLSALATGDVETLTKLTNRGSLAEEDVRKEWEKTMRISKHYRFQWTIVAESLQGDDVATVRTQVQKNYGPGSYPENFGIQLTKVDGAWKVDVKGISRTMFPALPRLEGGSTASSSPTDVSSKS